MLRLLRKRHVPGAMGFAVFDEDLYLGDVTPADEHGRKAGGTIAHEAWTAHPAGSEVRLAMVFVSRATAARALASFAERPSP